MYRKDFECKLDGIPKNHATMKLPSPVDKKKSGVTENKNAIFFFFVAKSTFFYLIF